MSFSRWAPYATVACCIIAIVLSYLTDFMAATLMGIIPTAISIGLIIMQRKGNRGGGRRILLGLGLTFVSICAFMVLYLAAITSCGVIPDAQVDYYDVVYRCDSVQDRGIGIMNGMTWFFAGVFMSHSLGSSTSTNEVIPITTASVIGDHEDGPDSSSVKVRQVQIQ